MAASSQAVEDELAVGSDRAVAQQVAVAAQRERRVFRGRRYLGARRQDRVGDDVRGNRLSRSIGDLRHQGVGPFF